MNKCHIRNNICCTDFKELTQPITPLRPHLRLPHTRALGTMPVYPLAKLPEIAGPAENLLPQMSQMRPGWGRPHQ